MILIDANVIIAAADQDHPHHPAAGVWLRELLDSGEGFVIPDVVWLAFFRILSSGAGPRNPVPMADLSEWSQRLRAEYDYLPISGIHDRWDTFEELVMLVKATGKLTTDAYLAALARELSCRVATFDRDFRRFDGVKVVVPGA